VALITKLADDPEGKAIADDPTLANTTVAERLGVSEASVRRYRKQTGWERALPSPTTADDGDRPEGPSLDITGNVGQIYSGPLDEPITDETGWAPVMRLLGIGDPENWMIVGEVKISTWQQSKGLDDGSRNTVLLYSYRARIARKTEEVLQTEEELQSAVKRMKSKRYSTRAPKNASLGPAVGYCHHQGDEQIGKNRNNNGLVALEAAEGEVLQKSLDAISGYIKRGINVTEILDNAAGDRIENVFGHYASQQRTTNSMRDQIAYAVESDIARTEAFAAFGLPITKVYTPSNHGEMRTVTGGSSAQSESDNWDLIIAEMVKRVIDRSPLADQVTWHIPHDNPITLFNFMGVNIAATHGHKADKQGRLYNWVKNQQGLANQHMDFKMQLMLMGHKHHFHLEDVSGTLMLQTGSLDQGSPYVEHGRGDRASGGALGFLVSAGFKGGVAKIDLL